jgi:hypothetical protein
MEITLWKSVLQDAATAYGLRLEDLLPANLSGDISQNNLANFFSHDYVKRSLLESKEKIFSRADRVSPQERFRKAVYVWASLIGRDSSSSETYLRLRPAQELLVQLEEYYPPLGKGTIASREKMRSALRKFSARKEKMLDVGLHPLIYGSVRYGDAIRSSDLDIYYLSTADCDVDPTIGQRQRQLFGTLDDSLGDCDEVDSAILLINLAELHGALVDIAEGNVTSVDDYKFKGNVFFPYTLLLEGLVPKNFSCSEIEEAKELIRNGLEVDPFFNLLSAYNLFFSLKKRQQNWNRLKQQKRER